MDELNAQTIIGVVGSGTMGQGIAQTAASYNHKVILYDLDNKAVERAKENLEKIFFKLVEKGKYKKEEAWKILNNIDYKTDINALSSSGLIIEAIVEKLNIKNEVFSQLEKVVSKNTVLATNTSSLSITAIASNCNKPERVIGTHFFNPAPIMQLVEVIPAIQTSSIILEETKKLICKWEKICVFAKDTPGFIVNRVARPFYGEAIRILDEGIANAATIDYAMKEIGKFKMGPFELMDLIGNDINYKVTETVFEQFYFDPRFKPSVTQKRLVEANYLGRKTKKGFYDYSESDIKHEVNKNENLLIEIFFRILVMLINEAADALFMNVASLEDIELAMTKGVNYPRGLFKWADEIGLDKVVKRINILFEEYGEDRYRLSPLLKRMAKENRKFYE